MKNITIDYEKVVTSNLCNQYQLFTNLTRNV